MMLGDLDSYMQRKETRSPTYTIHKNKFKVDRRLKYKLRQYKSPRGEHKQESLRYSKQQHIHQYVPYSKEHKGKIKNWDLIKIKSFCMAKENSSKIKIEPIIWENIFASDILDKGLISKIYKTLMSSLQEAKQPN